MKILTIIFLTLILLAGTAYADIPIYCAYCKAYLYNYSKDEITPGTQVRAEDFKPANNTIPQPVEGTIMVCPLCQAPLNGYEYMNWKDKAPLPVFKFPAVTMLTKDKDGNWKWVPYELNRKDWEK